jgi:hypothetical protein
MKQFPIMTLRTEDDLFVLGRYILKERSNDINDFNNLQNIFMRGRKVGKIPTGSADISADDRLGDFNYNNNYLYIVVDNAGSAEWRRVSLSSW